MACSQISTKNSIKVTILYRIREVFELCRFFPQIKGQTQLFGLSLKIGFDGHGKKKNWIIVSIISLDVFA